MTKVAIVTDTHFGVKKGDAKMAAYMSRFFNEVFFPEIDRRGIKHVIHGGDLFDNRMEVATHVFDSVLDSFINPCLERNLEVWEVLGNHDTRYKNTNRVNTPSVVLGRNLAGNKFDNRNYHLITDDVTEVKIGSRVIGLVPWITPENEERILRALENTKASVILGHFEIAGAKMDRVQVAQHGLSASLFSRFDLVMSGHFHHKSKYGNILYLGGPYEFTWIDSEDPKGFHIFDTETLELEFIQNPFTMFNKIVFNKETNLEDVDMSKITDSYVRVIVEDRDRLTALNDCINTLSKYVSDVKVIENPAILAKVDQPTTEIDIQVEDTMDIINEYIDAIAAPEIAMIAKAHVMEMYRKVVL